MNSSIQKLLLLALDVEALADLRVEIFVCGGEAIDILGFLRLALLFVDFAEQKVNGGFIGFLVDHLFQNGDGGIRLFELMKKEAVGVAVT